MSIQNPSNFLEWKSNQEDLINSLINNKTLPAITDFPFISNNSPDYTEMIKATIVGGLSVVPAVGTLCSTLVDAMWSHYLANQDTSLDLWNSFSVMIKNLIDNGIDQYDRDVVIAKVAGVKTYISKFYTSRKAWAKNGTVANKKECADAFDDLEDVLRALLVDQGEIRKTNYAFQELGAFAALATSHLLLLKDVITNGKKWNMTDSKIQEYSTFLTTCIPDYIKHTKVSYQAGCTKIRNLPNLDGPTKFNRLNSFRSFCTRYVFDYVNLWTSFDKTIFPNGVYSDNVRYIWTDILGRPVDISKSVTNGSPFYYPSCEFLEKFFNDKNMDEYKKELKRVEVVNDNYWIYSILPFFKDPSESNGEHCGERAGNSVKTGGYIFNFPSSAIQTTMNGDYDVQPRFFSLPQCVSPNQSSVTINLGNSKSSCGEIYDTFLDRLQCTGDLGKHVQVSASIPNHKIGFIRGGNINNEVYTYYSIDEKYAGILDSIYTAMIPVNIFNENYVFPKVATIVNVQKYFNRTSGCSFQRDHVLPSIHSVLMNAEDIIRFRFTLIDSTVQTYYVGIRYHYRGTDTTGSLHIRNANGVNLPGGAITLEKCSIDSDGNGVNEYKYAIMSTKIIDFSKLPTKQLAIYSKSSVYIHSIILFPTTLPVSA